MVDRTVYSSNLGALVFWAYIVAALVLTSLLLWTIASTPLRHPSSRQKYAAFCVLTALSFGWLSYRMLSVLILSYQSWARARSIPLPTRLFGQASALGEGSLLLWEWSTTSTLFKDFGDALVADRSTWAWSNAALALTFVNVLYICVEGRRANVPHLWAFVAVAEILPISFAQNLFLLMLIRHSAATRSTTLHSNLPGVIGGTGYLCCLVVAPSSGVHLISIILIARLLLALPLALSVDQKVEQVTSLSSRSTHASTSARIVGTAAILYCTATTMLAISERGLNDFMAGLHRHPAVAALGDDFLISVGSWIAWYAFPSTTKARKTEIAKRR